MQLAKKLEKEKKQKEIEASQSSAIPDNQEGVAVTRGGSDFILPKREAAGLADIGKLTSDTTQAEQINKQAEIKKANALLNPTQPTTTELPTQTPVPNQTDFNSRPDLTGFQGFLTNKVNPSLFKALEFFGGEFQTDASGVPTLTKKGARKLGIAAGLTGLGIASPEIIGAIRTAKTAETTAAVANTVSKSKGSSNAIIKWALGLGISGIATSTAYKFINRGNDIIKTSESAVSDIEQSASKVASTVNLGGEYTFVQGLSDLNDMELELNHLESAIQTAKIYSSSQKANPEFSTSAMIKLQRARLAIDAARQQILNSVQNGGVQ